MAENERPRIMMVIICWLNVVRQLSIYIIPVNSTYFRSTWSTRQTRKEGEERWCWGSRNSGKDNIMCSELSGFHLLFYWNTLLFKIISSRWNLINEKLRKNYFCSPSLSFVFFPLFQGPIGPPGKNGFPVFYFIS
jgi:hypothetical protein